MRLYWLRAFCPAELITQHLDGTPMLTRFVITWCTLVGGPVQLDSVVHELAIDAPYWVPERILKPPYRSPKSIGCIVHHEPDVDGLG